MTELQADEMRAIVGDKEQSIWIFAVMDVWSRLWPSTIVGRRSFRNTLALFRDLSGPVNVAFIDEFPVIAHFSHWPIAHAQHRRPPGER